MDERVVHQPCEHILDEVSNAVVADDRVLRRVLTGFLASGHVLLEDVPGTGKTLTGRSFADALGLSFSRIQFTPDLLPSDVTGINVFNEKRREFEFDAGPVFANVVLADEINRASPKTQAALLEAMQEGQVTVDGQTRLLPEPFFVIATQNPIEQEGTFPLPEAQRDRFIIKTRIGYPDHAGEVELLDRRADRQTQIPSVSQVCSGEDAKALQSAPEEATVDPDVREYVASITRATRTDGRVEVGVSPRGTQQLFEVARAAAVIDGRDYVTPRDVKELAEPVLAHRLVLSTDARVDSVDRRTVVGDTVTDVPVPTVDTRSTLL